MIRILDGIPGSGKSYHAVELMIEDFRQGKTVVTNLPLYWDRIKEYCARPRPGLFRSRPGVVLEDSQLRILTEEETKDFWKFLPAGTLDCKVEGYFDELQNLFNARNWEKTQKLHGEVLKFISHHRHYHTNLSLLTQDRGNIDKQFRVMCGQYWEHVNMPEEWGILGLKWPLPTFFRRLYGRDEDTCIRRKMLFKDKEIWNLYDSHNKVEGIELKSQVSRLKLVVAKVTLAQQIATMLKTWVVIIGLVLGGGWWGYNKFIHSDGSRTAPGILGAPGGQRPGTSPPVPPPVDVRRNGAFVSLEPPKPHDDIIVEKLRYAEGNYHRRTDKSSYTLYRPCPYGFVTRVEDDFIMVKRIDGTILTVILDGATIDSIALSAHPVTPPAPPHIDVPPVAVAGNVYPQWTPAQSFSQQESARISASLRGETPATSSPNKSGPPGQSGGSGGGRPVPVAGVASR